MKKDEVEFIDFGHCLHMDTKQPIIYNGKEYNCIKGAVFHKKRSLRKNTKCFNFNLYWMEHRKKIIKSIYRNIITNHNEVLSSKNIRNSLLMNNEFAYIDNGNRHLGIGFFSINKNTNEVNWLGKNIMGEIFKELKEELA